MNMINLIFLMLLLSPFGNKSLEGIPESDSKADYKVKSLSDVNKIANSLKEEILHSKTELIVSGTSYYVSNKGDDANSGKSPSEAWATLSKVSGADLKDGDGVLFERGGIWRGSFITKTGVSYSAYGAGEKPKIIGSLQNYSIKQKWNTTGTPNVYVYDQVLINDAGLLVFNQGEAYTYKKVVGIDGFSGSLGELKNDLEMYHNINDKKVYLYSGKGNPADRFSVIEFCLKDHIIKIKGNNIKIDNLCIKYGGAHGISAGSCNGLTVTNCEFGWIGGSIQQGKTRYGNAIEVYGACNGYIVDHCYIYQIYDAGVTHQYKNSTSTETKIMENVTYSNNLIEFCIYSFEYFLDQPNSRNDVMKNITIKDNICRNTGYGFGWQRPDKVARHIQGGWLGAKRKYPAENFVIEGNIFDRSRDVLLSISALEEAHLPKMKNNIYIQNKGGKFGMHGLNYNQYYPFDQDIKKLLKEKGIEDNPTIIFVD
jgi:hypothetical protein